MTVYPWCEETREALPPVEKPDTHPNPVGRCETATPTPVDVPLGYVPRAVLTGKGWFDSWETVVDHRGKEYWTLNGEKHSIVDLGVTVPVGCLTTPPPSPLHRTHDGIQWIIDVEILSETRRQQRDAKISGIYVPASQQLSRWIDGACGDALAYYLEQRATWHAWADALCNLPGQPGWPWPDGEVPWPQQPQTPTRYTPTR